MIETNCEGERLRNMTDENIKKLMEFGKSQTKENIERQRIKRQQERTCDNCYDKKCIRWGVNYCPYKR